ncbi:MAG TPA: response regulator [Bacteroidota bacterium]|nr:response regulator [Bacteroidota bacterium]
MDDDEMHLALIRQVLGTESIAMLSTADGPRGLTLFAEHRPDLVLLDLGLPSMNGLDVLKEIRKIDANAKVMVVTGYASGETISLAEKSGALEVIQKPIDLKTFLSKIHHALNTSDPLGP